MFSDAIILGEKSKYGKQYYLHIEEIIPNRVVKEKSSYRITYLSPFLKINGFVVVVNSKELVENVFILGLHPNCNLETNLYCLEKHKKRLSYNEDYYKMLKQNLKVYYLDNCYYIPTGGYLQYEKMKSVYIQFNEQEKNK